MIRRTHRNRTFCEAICGVVVETEGERPLSVRGGDDDPLSHGYIEAHARIGVQEEPDCVRRPLRRRRGGWREIGWKDGSTEPAARRASGRQNWYVSLSWSSLRPACFET